jgi:hypothetical protein
VPHPDGSGRGGSGSSPKATPPQPPTAGWLDAPSTGVERLAKEKNSYECFVKRQQANEVNSMLYHNEVTQTISARVASV